MRCSRHFLLAMFLVCFSFAQAQKNKPIALPPAMPVDSVTRLITYSEVVQVPGMKPVDLYNRALSWAQTYYKNPADVIREKNPAEGKLLIKARYKIYNEPDKEGTVTNAGDVMYTLTIWFKDGRYKYEMTRFNWQQLSSFPAERWTDSSSSSYVPAYAHYLKQTDEKTKEILSLLRKKMSEDDAKPANDW
jgi:hypothetical protein